MACLLSILCSAPLKLAAAWACLRVEGGDLDATVTAVHIGTVSRLTNASTLHGGDVLGSLSASTIGSIDVTGGDLRASITTFDPRANDTTIDVRSYQGKGGHIYSPGSFHIAGAVARISANDILLGLHAGAHVESIVLSPAPGTTGSLRGNWDAGSPAPYLDVSGDGFLAPIDALQVIAKLNAGGGEGEGESVRTSHNATVPHPQPFFAMIPARSDIPDRHASAEETILFAAAEESPGQALQQQPALTPHEIAVREIFALQKDLDDDWADWLVDLLSVRE